MIRSEKSLKRMLKRYGESSTGEAICRDVLIPSDMPLHNLHYAIQKLYGWQNSHLRCFRLPEEVYQKLTGGTVKGWSDLVGILFQPPSECEEDIFWDDDYEKGSINAWLKKKYTGWMFFHELVRSPVLGRGRQICRTRWQICKLSSPSPRWVDKFSIRELVNFLLFMRICRVFKRISTNKMEDSSPHEDRIIM